MATQLSEPVFNPENFFAAEGEKGMTSTSANKLANLAKERNREDMLYVENVRFYSDIMSLLVTPNEKVTLSEGLPGTPEEFTKIREAIKRIARFNAFISWVREAISAKEQMIEKVATTSVANWCKERNIEYPKVPDTNVTEELKKKASAGEATIDEMAQYFIAQSKASTIGQSIHPSGPIDKARRELIDAGLKPTTREGSGKDTVIITKVPTATPEEVTNFYMELQSDWRQAESRVNESKNKWTTKDAEMKIQLTNEFNGVMRKYNEEVSHIKENWEKWKLEETKRLGKLKIHIPLALQSVMDELLALGKD